MREELFCWSFEFRIGFGLIVFFGFSDFCRFFGLDVGIVVFVLGMIFFVIGWMFFINGFDFFKVNKKLKKCWFFFFDRIFFK